MKKYERLSELVKDIRKFNNLTQGGLAGLLKVDTRTVMRWESDDSLLKNNKVKEFAEKLFIPYQVIHNLNSERPITIYFSIKNRTYSFTSSAVKVIDPSWFNLDLPKDNERIHMIESKEDIEFVERIQIMQGNKFPMWKEVFKQSVKIIPDLNLVLLDQAGFFAGHISIIPLKYTTYLKLKSKEIKENEISITDLTSNFGEKPFVFYYYSLYADSMSSTYCLMNRILTYFNDRKFKDYLFAGITFRDSKIALLKEMGLKEVWDNINADEVGFEGTLFEGTFDGFLNENA
jgi:transcriptional regulator with XRE-family HTH domain